MTTTPLARLQMYGFRNIPLEGMTYTLILPECKNPCRSEEVQKHIPL